MPPPPSWSYPPPSARGSVLPDAPSSETLEGDPLLYVTTASGVTRARASDLEAALDGAALVVDTVRHTLRVHGKEISLERRRALEPLVVQLFRRAREGLSAEEILRAAGGPGPESADAEHRVRVLISRVRDLFGDVGTIERLRDAGERGRTRYRLAPGSFALIEPLYAPWGGAAPAGDGLRRGPRPRAPEPSPATARAGSTSAPGRHSTTDTRRTPRGRGRGERARRREGTSASASASVSRKAASPRAARRAHAVTSTASRRARVRHPPAASLGRRA